MPGTAARCRSSGPRGQRRLRIRRSALVPGVLGVFGEVSGGAPGYRGTLTWGMASFDTEVEYLIVADDSADSYFYSRSELTPAPLDWMTVGLVVQRTRAYASSRDLQ